MGVRTLSMIMSAALLPSAQGDVTVHTVHGDTLRGTAVTTTHGHVYVQHPVFGVLKLAQDEVAGIDAGDEDSSHAPLHVGVNSAATQAMAADVLACAEADEPTPWTGTLGAAVTASYTTQDTLNLRLHGSLNHADDTGTTTLKGTWYLNTTEGSVTDNDALIRGERQWAMQDPALDVFAQATWQFDQFESWGHRVSPYAGIGWQAIDEDHVQLQLKGGGGGTWEYGSGMTEPQLLLDADGSLVIGERQRLVGQASIAPNVNAWSDYLATVRLEWQMLLRDDRTVAWSVGVRNIYDATPASGTAANDLKLWTGLNWTF